LGTPIRDYLSSKHHVSTNLTPVPADSSKNEISFAHTNFDLPKDKTPTECPSLLKVCDHSERNIVTQGSKLGPEMRPDKK